jgi:hypothetical protein
MTTKAYQIKYHEVSISYLYLSNSFNLTKKTKLIFLKKLNLTKSDKKRTPEILSHF